MAKVVIEIEDMPGDKVKAVMTPSFETMAMMNESGNQLTSAQAYAVFMINELRKEAKRSGPTNILIPRIRY